MAISLRAFFWILVFVAFVRGSSPHSRPRVHPGVYRRLRQQAAVNLMVTMRGKTIAELQEEDDLESATASSRGVQIASLVNSLKIVSANAQRPVTELIAEESATLSAPLFTSSKTLWVSNQVFMANASVDLLQKLMSVPSIDEIREEQIYTMEDNIESEILNATSNANYSAPVVNGRSWNLEKIGATELWAKGITGENITVATIDSGVRVTHEVLRDNFLGDYGWYDPEAKRAIPYDSSGHGTHVMGSLVGMKGVGVAPGAKWIACRGCSSSTSCRESSLLACAQFILCPTDPEGKNSDCSKAPHVVNNSWGIFRGTDNFSAVIAAWRFAGIIPIFSVGNSGSASTCSTVVSPADANNVIGVGAISVDDSLLSQSSTGPSTQGRIKPDIVAPGVRIYSAWWTRDNVYAITSGTSMAAPHVAGAIALILSTNPTFTFEQIWSALTISAVQDSNMVNSVAARLKCGNIPASTFPNNIFGYGVLNVQRALTILHENDQQ